MREAIERVISNLESRHRNCCKMSNFDKADAYETAINQLKEVLSHEPKRERGTEHHIPTKKET